MGYHHHPMSHRSARPKASDYDICSFKDTEQGHDDKEYIQAEMEFHEKHRLDNGQMDSMSRDNWPSTTAFRHPWQYDTAIALTKRSRSSPIQIVRSPFGPSQSLSAPWEIGQSVGTGVPNQGYSTEARHDLFHWNYHSMYLNASAVPLVTNGCQTDPLSNIPEHILAPTAPHNEAQRESVPVPGQCTREGSASRRSLPLSLKEVDLDTSEEEWDDTFDGFGFLNDVTWTRENRFPVQHRNEALEATMDLADAQERQNRNIPSRYFRDLDKGAYMASVTETSYGQTIMDDPMFAEIEAGAPTVPFWQLRLQVTKLKIENNGWNNFSTQEAQEETACDDSQGDQMSVAMSESEQGSPQSPMAKAVGASRIPTAQEKPAAGGPIRATLVPLQPSCVTSTARLMPELQDRTPKLVALEKFTTLNSDINDGSHKGPNSSVKYQKPQPTAPGTPGPPAWILEQHSTIHQPHPQGLHIGQTDKSTQQHETSCTLSGIVVTIDDDGGGGGNSGILVKTPTKRGRRGGGKAVRREKKAKKKAVRFADIGQQTTDDGTNGTNHGGSHYNQGTPWVSQARVPEPSKSTLKATPGSTRNADMDVVMDLDTKTTSPMARTMPSLHHHTGTGTGTSDTLISPDSTLPSLLPPNTSARTLCTNPKPSLKRRYADSDGAASPSQNHDDGAECKDGSGNSTNTPSRKRTHRGGRRRKRSRMGNEAIEGQATEAEPSVEAALK